MKKILNKLRRKKVEDAPSRITSDTVAEHRELVLAGGRRFKYPIQYAKHKLVINAVLISVVALIIVVVVGWWQIYPMQNTSEFIYRVTKVLPLPVAYVDGEQVLYSDYLMKYRSSVHYLEKKELVSFKTDDGKRQLEYLKSQSIDDAIADSYAQKLARDLGLSVSDEEVENFIKLQRQSSDGEVSENTYEAVIKEFYDWSPSEYRHITSRKLLRQKVSYTMDDTAKDLVSSISKQLSDDAKTDFKTISQSLNNDDDKKVSYGTSGLVSKQNQDGGLAVEAFKLEKGAVSGSIRSSLGDGYYFVRLLDKNDNSVSYEYIHVSLATFDKKIDQIKSDNLIQKLIDIKE